jgi:molybdopterin adenylyltransferase
MTSSGLTGMRAAIVTVSDSCFRGEREDESGAVVAQKLLRSGAILVDRVIVADDARDIRVCLAGLVDRLKAVLVVTTGGTGLGPRDVTPSATRSVVDIEIPGLSEAMRRAGARKTRRAYLSRGVCGVRGQALIVNVPGSPKGALESLEAVIDLIPHALAMIQGEGHGKVAKKSKKERA